MSAFIAPVHYWMYDKVITLRNLEDELAKLLETEDDLARFNKELAEQLADVEIDRVSPLEEIVDHQNIHGWLQSKVDIVETRFAKLVTFALGKGITLEQLIQTAKEHAKNLAEGIEEEAEKHRGSFIKSYKYQQPKEVYATLNTFLLEGMPCDRVSIPLKDSAEEFVWETTECLHQNYWQRINGDVSNFYKIRNEWIASFVGNLPKKYHYQRVEQDGKILNYLSGLEG